MLVTKAGKRTKLPRRCSRHLKQLRFSSLKSLLEAQATQSSRHTPSSSTCVASSDCSRVSDISNSKPSSGWEKLLGREHEPPFAPTSETYAEDLRRDLQKSCRILEGGACCSVLAILHCGQDKERSASLQAVGDSLPTVEEEEAPASLYSKTCWGHEAFLRSRKTVREKCTANKTTASKWW